MSAAVADKLWTAEDLDKFPDDGIERWIVRSELREGSVTTRNTRHASTESQVTERIGGWKRTLMQPGGQVFSGEAGIMISRDPDTTLGADVAYVSHEEMARQPANACNILVKPTLVVEVLSPSDTQERIDEKIDAYLAFGIPLIWVLNPARKTVAVYRPGEEPELFNVKQEVSAEPHMPGFRVKVAELFSPYL